MLEYRVNGRKVTLDQFMQHMQTTAVDAAASGVERRIARIRCPVHGQYAKAHRKSMVGDRIEWSVTGCCERVIQRARASLR